MQNQLNYNIRLLKKLFKINKYFHIRLINDRGVKVFIDLAAVINLLGTQMDYKKDKFSSFFILNNPNETERCGCGESFKI